MNGTGEQRQNWEQGTDKRFKVNKSATMDIFRKIK